MSDLLPISMIQTLEARNWANAMLFLGITADEMRVVRTASGEGVVINKAGLIKLARLSPYGPAEALRRLSGVPLVDMDGAPTGQTVNDRLTLDDELEIFRE